MERQCRSYKSMHISSITSAESVVKPPKMATAKERLLLLIPTTIIETLLAIASRTTADRPATIFLYALAINFVLLATWSIFIWPFLFNPLRHLPTVRVTNLLHKMPNRQKYG